MQRISQTSVWYGGMTLNSKAIHEHCVSGGVNRESGCSAMRNGGVGHNVSTAAPRQRCESRNCPAAIAAAHDTITHSSKEGTY